MATDNISLSLVEAAALTSAASIVVDAFERIGGGADVVLVNDLSASEAGFLSELEALGLIERKAAPGFREHLTFVSDLLEAITKVGAAIAPHVTQTDAAEGKPTRAEGSLH